jgi:hypothetical protein
MSQQDARADIKEATIEVTVIRKDGTREDHGVVSYYHRNPFKRALWALKQKAKEQVTDGYVSSSTTARASSRTASRAPAPNR